jgi:hypothetical protein
MMRAPSRRMLARLQMVRRSAVVITQICDALILGQGGTRNQADAMTRLRPALRLLLRRAQQALDALAQEEGTP